MAKVIGGTTTTPMRMPESGGGAIYLPASEANYSLLKDYLDKGQSVIIVKDGMHYYCVSRSNSNITFQSTCMERVYILDYSESMDEPYDGGTTLLNYADVQNNYDPSSFYPISGVGVAEALVDVGRQWKCIADVEMETDSIIEVHHNKYFDAFDLQINTLGVPTENCVGGTPCLFYDLPQNKAIAFSGLLANNIQYYVVRFHGVLENGIWKVNAYNKTTNWQSCEKNYVNVLCQHGEEYACTTPINEFKLNMYLDVKFPAGTKYKLFVKEVADQ